MLKTKLRRMGLEEHFMVPEFEKYLAENYQNISPEMGQRASKLLLDFGDRRLEVMDRNGIDFAVLSLAGPGVQAEKDADVAARMARKVNDILACEIQQRPSRYGGFAHLAMHDPVEAAAELERCIVDLRLQGAMINGQTMGRYLDDSIYNVFWERAEALRAPIYIHPANPVDRPAMFHGHQEMWGPVCSWGFETCAHALRLVFSGIFERYPEARIILGHMGETIPIQMWRFDSRWPISHRDEHNLLPHPPSIYLRRNIAITTSGVCSPAALQCALSEMGEDQVMFSIDYPFEDTASAVSFLNNAPISDVVREKVAYRNAERILCFNDVPDALEKTLQ